MPEGARHISRFVLMHRAVDLAVTFFPAMGVAVAAGLLTSRLTIAVAAGIISWIILLLWKKPWKMNVSDASEILDKRIEALEFSSALVLTSSDSLTSVARVQQRRVAAQLAGQRLVSILPLKNMFLSMLMALIIVAIGFILTRILMGSQPEEQLIEVPVHVPEKATGSEPFPVIQEAQILAKYPSYTGIGTQALTSLSVQVLQGSVLKWEIGLSGRADSLILDVAGGQSVLFEKSPENTWTLQWRPDVNTFYSFRIVKKGETATSDVYSIDLVADQPPEIRPVDVQDFLEFEGPGEVEVRAELTDDFGLTDAYIVATVSRGSGESVKFREVVLPFPAEVSGRQTTLSRRISMDSIGMGPGDELYYYLEALDNRIPEPGRSRSVTFFAVIKDTVSREFMSGGAMAVDLMPDYFRSQRQIIIDTEALIATKPSMELQAFKQESNSLGYDQKLLRIKYGQYLGDEFESGMTEMPAATESEGESDPEEDPVAAYTHDHDHEHEGVAENEAVEEEEDPLEAYMHDHSDPEEATLYTQGIRAMLKQAMAEMWDAELYLRLYEPEKSLSYQYKALDLIQKIKNQARIYVHRIGFDPPPIREDSRLTADLDEIGTPRTENTDAAEDKYRTIRRAVELLLTIGEENYPSESTRSTVFGPASETLARLAVESPGSYLQPLSLLQRIQVQSWETIRWEEVAPQLAGQLMAVLPDQEIPGQTGSMSWNRLDSLFQIHLEGGRHE